MKEKTAQAVVGQAETKDTKVETKRILYIITKSVFGGAGRYVFELAKRSKHEGFETAVALGGNGILKQKLEEEGITVFPLDSAQRDISLAKEFKLLIRLLHVVREYKPTVMHLNSPKIGGLGAVVGRLCKVPNILYTNHGWPFKEDRPAWQLVLIRFFSWLTIFFNKKVIVLSETEKGFVQSWPFAKKKLVVVPNGLSKFELKSKEESLKSLLGTHYPVANNTLILGTISELHKNKGLTYAIEGIRMFCDHFPEQKVIFIVIGEGERRKELEELIASKDLSKSVFLVGHVDDARSYLKAFDVFIMSSVKEGLPYAILEAGVSRVPIISTSVGAIPEIIRNFNTGLLIPPRRSQEIKNALIYYTEHPEVIDSCKETLEKEVLERFDFNKIYKQLLELY
jgi:glycosyltransferase involved in cell wall biosynthesis